MKDRCDLVLVNPGDKRQVYQDLGKDFAAIEPPFWVAVIAAFLRNHGFSVQIIDANAENISPDETAAKVKELNPLLAAVIVYGSNPSASTPNMPVTGRICRALKENTPSRVAIGGLHPSALPKRTLEEEKVDFVIEGEGPLTLESLLIQLRLNKDDYSVVPGLWYYVDGVIRNNPKPPLISNLDEGLPIAAWDLLPMEKYKAHNWHCFGDLKNRMPYGAIYTSLGCPYSCVFCCINVPFGKPGIRYRSPQLVVEEIGLLVEKYGVKNIKIVDELFILNERHYMGIVDLLLKKGYDLNMWAYARVDSLPLNEEMLKRMKQAGINWLGIGVESGNQRIRERVTKGKFIQGKIRQVIDMIHAAGIYGGANYIFGLPDDDLQTMQETLNFAKELNCEYANFYVAMAYPGSKLYEDALREGLRLPESWLGYAQLSEETMPLPTKFLSSEEILLFRDRAFEEYYSNPRYLKMIEEKFGLDTVEHIKGMLKHKIERRLLKNSI